MCEFIINEANYFHIIIFKFTWSTKTMVGKIVACWKMLTSCPLVSMLVYMERANKGC